MQNILDGWPGGSGGWCGLADELRQIHRHEQEPADEGQREQPRLFAERIR